MRSRLFFTLLLSMSLSGFAGCEQGEGDRCEVTSDCEDGLICCIPAGTLEGTCQHEENCQNQ